MNIFRSIFILIISIALIMDPGAAIAKKKSKKKTIIKTVSSDRAYVRKDYKPKAEVLFTVLKNFPVKILKSHGSWYKIADFEGDEGWIYGKTLTSKKRCCIVKNNKFANIREKNDTKSRILYKADYGVAFEVLKKKGDWLNIKHANGKKGWIHKSLTWGKY